jgi:shikimate kinase
MSSIQPETATETPTETPTETMSNNEPGPHPIPAHLRRLVLTGFMGAGKSTIGRLLATRLNWQFLDLDAHLEARTGATILSSSSATAKPTSAASNPPPWPQLWVATIPSSP